jgi:hypothetical protein
VLLRSLNERLLWLLVPLFVAQATLLRPDGYRPRTARYYRTVGASYAARVSELCAAPFSNADWDRGVRTSGAAAGFCVQYAGDLRAIHPGAKLRFAGSGVREVERVSDRQVWVAGPPLDPVQDGCPRPIGIVSEQDIAPPRLAADSRVLTWLQANQNLFTGVESVCVFNPVLNRRFAAVFPVWFSTFGQACDLQIDHQQGELTARHVNALRLLGVRAIYGFDVAVQDGVTRAKNGVSEVEGALPRMFLLREEDYVAIESSWGKVPLEATLAALRAAIGTRALAVTIGTRSIAFQAPESFRGRLVANQAFSRAWTYAGREGQPFCGLFPSWKVDLEGGASAHEIKYWPRGLTPALWIACAGVLVGLVGLIRAGRRRSAERRMLACAA